MAAAIFGESGRGAFVAKIHSRHSARLKAASASAKDGVFFDVYHGSDGQVFFVPCVAMYQLQVIE